MFDTNEATDKNEIITHLKIYNNGKQANGMNLVFKIKTTAPKLYQVRPIQGILGPDKMQQIEIRPLMRHSDWRL